jgi:hypothetical protein
MKKAGIGVCVLGRDDLRMRLNVDRPLEIDRRDGAAGAAIERTNRVPQPE